MGLDTPHSLGAGQLMRPRRRGSALRWEPVGKTYFFQRAVLALQPRKRGAPWT